MFPSSAPLYLQGCSDPSGRMTEVAEGLARLGGDSTTGLDLPSQDQCKEKFQHCCEKLDYDDW